MLHYNRCGLPASYKYCFSIKLIKTKTQLHIGLTLKLAPDIKLTKISVTQKFKLSLFIYF